MTEKTYRNFVAAEPVATPRAELLRREDIMRTVEGVLDTYNTQQRAVIQSLQGETVGGRGFLSDADQVRERRKTSALYLAAYGAVAAMTIGGLAYLATLAGVNGAVAFAGWMTGTGGLTLYLAWRRHGDEFAHSPEGIARLVVEAHWALSEYEAETRRLALRWEHQAEARRQRAAEQAAEHGRQLAALRVEELNARRRAIEAQRASRQEALQAPFVAHEVQPIESAEEAPQGAATWQAELLNWVANLYAPGATTKEGIIKGRVPWAARSPWVESDKAAAKRVCCELRPKLIVPSDGGRWRLRVEAFPDAEQALRLLSARL